MLSFKPFFYLLLSLTFINDSLFPIFYLFCLCHTTKICATIFSIVDKSSKTVIRCCPSKTSRLFSDTLLKYINPIGYSLRRIQWRPFLFYAVRRINIIALVFWLNSQFASQTKQTLAFKFVINETFANIFDSNCSFRIVFILFFLCLINIFDKQIELSCHLYYKIILFPVVSD